MKFGPSRGNPLIIFEHFFKDFGLLVLAVIIAIVKGPELLLDNIQIFALVFINPIAALIKYLFTKYSITDDKMIINSGLFVKKTMEIPLKVITTVDLSQNLLFQFFHVYKIKADNSCQVNDNAKQAEIVLALKESSAYYVKSLLESKREDTTVTSSLIQENKMETPTIHCSITDFFLLGALQSKFIYFITIFTTVCGGGSYLYKLFSEQLHIDKLIENFINTLTPVIGISILFFAAYIVSFLTSMVVAAIRYYDYTVINRDDALLVKYGLFTKKSYTLMKEKISGVTIRQSPLMRLLGYCTVNVFIIGYGDKSEGKEEELSLLYPVAKLNEVNTILEQLLPDMSFDRTYHKRLKGSLHYFFLCFRMFFATVLFIGVLISLFAARINLPYAGMIRPAILVGSLAILFLTVISVFLEYLNSGIYANQKVVSVCKGCFSLNMIFIKAEKLESVADRATIWKKKKGFTTIRLGFVAPLRVANLSARNISRSDYEEVQRVMSY